MANKRLVNERHREQMQRYRARLKAKATPKPDGATAPRGAPETRAVVQGLAAGVRSLAVQVCDDPTAVKTLGRVYGELLAAALDSLVAAGFDRAESKRRLTFYTLPAPAKSKRRKADIEKRYWEQPPTSGVRRVTDPNS